jgi:hypothetical protein
MEELQVHGESGLEGKILSRLEAHEDTPKPHPFLLLIFVKRVVS